MEGHYYKINSVGGMWVFADFVEHMFCGCFLYEIHALTCWLLFYYFRFTAGSSRDMKTSGTCAYSFTQTKRKFDSEDYMYVAE